MAEDRREALKIIGSISATCAFPFSADELYGQHQSHGDHANAAELPREPRFFTPKEFDAVTRLADLIIPATGTPGAVAAGVPLYIDMVVGKNRQSQKLFRDGLKWLDSHSASRHGKRFVELEEARQIEILDPLCTRADQVTEAPAGSGRSVKGGKQDLGVRFFRAIKSMTADGFFTSKEGLVDVLGYKGNSVLPEFPTCIHEH